MSLKKTPSLGLWIILTILKKILDVIIALIIYNIIPKNNITGKKIKKIKLKPPISCQKYQIHIIKG
ncbi:MAG: hypothetical protein ACP6IY_15330 [Promethearchaeia archaeon]